MNLKKFKEKLKIEKENLETQLGKFATKDEKLKDDWDTRFPRFDSAEGGTVPLEEAADEVEEYSTLLPIEYSLELRLRNVNIALRKIEEGKYGICESCKKKIEKERLEVSPEAKLCIKCQIPQKK